jgi:hypothetical protein
VHGAGFEHELASDVGELIAALAAGALILGLLGAAVTTRLALRASPVEAMRGMD